MPNELNIEQMIREAMERGEFDNLAGSGKPLNLDAYFATPEDMRMAFAMLKSNEFVPEEVDMFKEIDKLKDEIKNCSDDREKASLTKQLQEMHLALTIALEKYKRKR